jgi:signal transduction histidine kinase
VSTAGGLSRFNPSTKTFINYYEADGLAGSAFEGYFATCQSRRGQMFFGSKSGLTSFWPEQIVERPFIPPVVLTGFSLRNLPVAPGPGSPLAQSIAFTRSLTLSHEQNMFSFEFAALSYVDPPRNRYRWMIEGLDHSWNRVDADHRLATFTTLPSRKYTLRIQGSNHRGVWNEQGVALQLQILPPWYGTGWFRALAAVALVALLWVGYQLRVRRLHREFNMRLEERVEERTRIARELHDTLLQSFQGLLLPLQGACNLLPGRAPEARQVLEKAIDDAARAVTEARDAVQGLRSTPILCGDLVEGMKELGQELASRRQSSEGAAPAFSVEVEGTPHGLDPAHRDEIYRVAGEALRNAFQHARARHIEVEIRYGTRELRVRVRDDGIGIEPEVVQGGGRAGHWGLKGIRERAKRIGGELEVWSERGAGTEVQLILPASIAYADGGRGFRLPRREKAAGS